MKLDHIRLTHQPLNEVTKGALLIADALQAIRTPEARAAGAMLFLKTYLDVLGEEPQDVATVVANMLAKAESTEKSRIRALAEYVADEMVKSRTADDILGAPEF